MHEPSVAPQQAASEPAAPADPDQGPHHGAGLGGAPRRRRRLWLYLAGALTLVLAGLCVAGAVKSDRDADPELVSFVAPDRIGALGRAADQAPAQAMADALGDSGLDRSVAVVYNDSSSPGRRVLIAGFSHWALTLLSPDHVLDSYFADAADNDDELGDRFDVDPVRRGAKAQCAEVLGEAERTTECGWTTGKSAFIAFVFIGYAPEDCAAVLRQIVPAVVHNG